LEAREDLMQKRCFCSPLSRGDRGYVGLGAKMYREN
jgi:hypothetical protein